MNRAAGGLRNVSRLGEQVAGGAAFPVLYAGRAGRAAGRSAPVQAAGRTAGRIFPDTTAKVTTLATETVPAAVGRSRDRARFRRDLADSNTRTEAAAGQVVEGMAAAGRDLGTTERSRILRRE